MSRKGRRINQRKRRRDRREGKVQKQSELYELIDGNLTYYPYAFCEHYNAWLTLGHIRTHKCLKRHCKQIRILKSESATVQGAEVTKIKKGG